LNLNLGGKEHMTVHFPVFLMNHVGILDREDWPRGVFVNWWLVGKGSKISKSKGGAEPIPDAAEKYGVDTLRLFYTHSSSPFVDKEWTEEEAFNYRKKLNSIWRLVNEMADIDGKTSEVDAYLSSRFNRLVKKAKELMDDYSLRKSASVVFYDIPSEIRWYLKRGGENGELLNEIGQKLTRLMAPYTPHIAEELSDLWDIDFVVEEGLPEVDTSAIDAEAEARERYLIDTMEDMKQILDVADVEGDKVYLYVAPDWKQKALSMILDNPEKGMGIMGDLVKEIDVPSKKLSSFAQNMISEIKKRGERDTWKVEMDETEILRDGKEFLEGEFDADMIIYAPDDEDIHDPAGKRRYAEPRKPAIYIE